MSLQEYRQKRNFKKTLEPKGIKAKKHDELLFVVQKHHASHLHYDFRLELDGVLKSWAVPKGPSLDPKTKRLAVQVEDHPLDYAQFEGEIPKDEYGGGHVIVWDTGSWTPPADAMAQLKKGRLEFELKGQKLEGRWVLVRTGSPAKAKKPTWLLIKRTDQFADNKTDITEEDRSVLSDRTVEMIQKPNKKAAVTDKVVFKKSKMPELKSPELAFLVQEPPVGNEWVHEIKFDGYRTLARKNKDQIQLFSRGGLDWSHKFPELLQACKKLKADSFFIDGEVAAIDEEGRTNFQALQNALESQQTKNLVYYVFDLIYLNGVDLQEAPLSQRKKVLEQLVKNTKSKNIIYSTHWTEDGADVFQRACEKHLEGIISKNIESTYEQGRSKNWLKTKCTHVQEFVIGGYTLQENGKLAALLMGAYNEDNKFQYIGRVGTGFNRETHVKLLKKLKALTTDNSSFKIKSPREKSNLWVRPELVAQIEFATWTDEHYLRHAAFKGLREDKKAIDVFMDEKELQSKSTDETKNKSKPRLKAKRPQQQLNLTHPDKILFPENRITKLDLAQYYISVQDSILPFLANRPLALLRCPNGQGGTCFFQKHVDSDGIGILKANVHSELSDKTEAINYLDSIQGIMELVQMGTLEIHVRGCQYQNIDYPDTIVFDLDPDPSVDFKQVKKAAFLLKDMLEKLGLKTFVKTTGGKGLHVQAPITPVYDWDQIKNFTHSVCEQLVKTHPTDFTTNNSKAQRKGKIFLDYLRNSYGATAAVAYTVRNKSNASVALPLTWDELKTCKAADMYTVKTVPELITKRKDPWPHYFSLKQRIKILDQTQEGKKNKIRRNK